MSIDNINENIRGLLKEYKINEKAVYENICKLEKEAERKLLLLDAKKDSMEFKVWSAVKNERLKFKEILSSEKKSADALFETACHLEKETQEELLLIDPKKDVSDYVVKSAILSERISFKHDLLDDAKEIEREEEER